MFIVQRLALTTHVHIRLVEALSFHYVPKENGGSSSMKNVHHLQSFHRYGFLKFCVEKNHKISLFSIPLLLI